MDQMCNDGVCGKCHGAKFIVVGLIVLANQYWLNLNWPLIIGLLLVLKGIMKLTMQGCGHCMPEKKGKK